MKKGSILHNKGIFQMIFFHVNALNLVENINHEDRTLFRFNRKLIMKSQAVKLLIGFNGMSTCLGIFYDKRLENRVHCMFIFTFFLRVSFLFFSLFFRT